MERIDKFITNHTEYSRSEVKSLISKKRVFVNDEVIKKSDIKIDENLDIIKIDGEIIKFQKYLCHHLTTHKMRKYAISYDALWEKYDWRHQDTKR